MVKTKYFHHFYFKTKLSASLKKGKFFLNSCNFSKSKSAITKLSSFVEISSPSAKKTMATFSIF